MIERHWFSKLPCNNEAVFYFNSEKEYTIPICDNVVSLLFFLPFFILIYNRKLQIIDIENKNIENKVSVYSNNTVIQICFYLQLFNDLFNTYKIDIVIFKKWI